MADAVAAVLQGIGYAETEARDMLGPSASGRLTDLKVRGMIGDHEQNSGLAEVELRFERPILTRVRVEIMGLGKYENVGKSQPVLIMINPIIFTRTRTDAAEQDSSGVKSGLVRLATAPTVTQAQFAQLVRAEAGLRVRLGAAAVASFLAAVSAEMYLCNVCSCQEILRRNGRGGQACWPGWGRCGRATRRTRSTRPRCATGRWGSCWRPPPPQLITASTAMAAAAVTLARENPPHRRSRSRSRSGNRKVDGTRSGSSSTTSMRLAWTRPRAPAWSLRQGSSARRSMRRAADAGGAGRRR
eukprot:COSAG01_NODE_1401_length_10450_cov_100.148198_12_plen_300_part_00